MNTRKPIILSLFVILIVLFQLVTPGAVRAQEETPPAEPPPTEEPADPASLPEALEQAPQGTEVVVLNEAGEAEPLATVEAAAIIGNGQAIWCPQGVLPSDANADASCTVAYDSLEGLVAGLTTYSGAGTIYIGVDYAVAPAAASSVSLDNHAASLDGLTALVVQGGWDYGAGVVAGNSLFAGQSLSFTWYNDLAINNLSILVDPGADYGLRVTTDDNAAMQTSSVTIDHVEISAAAGPEVNGATSVGLDVSAQGYEYGGGDVSITNVSVTGFDVGALVETDFGGDIAITNAAFAENGVGLIANNTGAPAPEASMPHDPECHTPDPGDITLINIYASENRLDGARLFSANDVTVSFSDFSFNGASGSGSGIEITAKGGISLSTVSASDNTLYGVLASAREGITADRIAASGNRYGAALFTAQGSDVTLTTGTFTENNIGLIVDNAGGALTEAYDPECEPVTGVITLTSVVASYNLQKGAMINSAGDVFITIGDFSFNGAQGGLSIFMNAPGSVSINVLALTSNAGNGVEVWAGVSTETFGGGAPRPSIKYEVMIACGAFYGNGGYGFFLGGDDAQSAVTFNTNDFAANATAPYHVGDAAFLEENLLDCFVFLTPPSVPLRTLPVRIVNGGVSQPVELDCVHYSGTIFVLPNGDKVTYYCPASGTVTTNSVPADDLPGDLDAGLAYVSALETALDDGGPVDILPDGRLRVTFAVPEGADAANLAILYWDPSLDDGEGDWVELPLAAWNTSLYDPTDGRMVHVGPYLNPENEFETIVNFTGTFVLVQK